MRALRVIDDRVAAASWHTAMSHVLLQDHAAGASPDCLRFYRFQPCVLLGHSQAAASSCNLDYCRANGVDIARRVTGGGAVYMSCTMLAWDLMIRASRRHTDLSEMVGRAMARAIASLGVSAEFRSPNDLVFAGAKSSGSKFSGAATTSFGSSFLIQGTLLLADEADAMSAALGIPLAALRAHVTSLDQCATTPIDTSMLQHSMTDSLAAAFDLKPIVSTLTATETDAADRVQHDFEVEYSTGVPA